MTVLDVERASYFPHVANSLLSRGYVTHLTDNDRTSIESLDELDEVFGLEDIEQFSCECVDSEIFAAGFRSPTSYRAFAVCTSCLRVVEEL